MHLLSSKNSVAILNACLHKNLLILIATFLLSNKVIFAKNTKYFVVFILEVFALKKV